MDMKDRSILMDRVAELLLLYRSSLSTAESCTGGALSAAITSRSGASDFFRGGVIAYSYALKTTLLGVSQDDLLTYGAVSEAVASQMAIGIRDCSGSTYGLATTGIAGPLGGSTEKPVGTVWIAIAAPDTLYTECLHLHGNRQEIVDATVRAILSKLCHLLNQMASNSIKGR